MIVSRNRLCRPRPRRPQALLRLIDIPLLQQFDGHVVVEPRTPGEQPPVPRPRPQLLHYHLHRLPVHEVGDRVDQHPVNVHHPNAPAAITAPLNLRIRSTRSGKLCTSTSTHSIQVSSSPAAPTSSPQGGTHASRGTRKSPGTAGGTGATFAPPLSWQRGRTRVRPRRSVTKPHHIGPSGQLPTSSPYISPYSPTTSLMSPLLPIA